MNRDTQRLPGVKLIGWLDCNSLPARADLHGITGTPLRIFAGITPVWFVDEPQCKCVTSRERGCISDTATLEFSTTERLPIHRRLGFVVVDQEGAKWLIGAKEPPFPVVECTAEMGAPSGKQSVLTYKVTHKALRSLVAVKAGNI